MFTPKEAREISEQRKKELEMKKPRKRDIRKVEKLIKQACYSAFIHKLLWYRSVSRNVN